ncbi:AsnC family transcriptional regulator, partial [Rhizobium johnstonii]|uniref:Lrp/AsnC family transcriptional regulator n=1 Tax=Rhizobium johnstonii TaxID=3019933 RepID=UPI003F9AB5D6
MPVILDPIYRHILRLLQRDGRISNVDLAREVVLSPSPCLRRVRLLDTSIILKWLQETYGCE